MRGAGGELDISLPRPISEGRPSHGDFQGGIERMKELLARLRELDKLDENFSKRIEHPLRMLDALADFTPEGPLRGAVVGSDGRGVGTFLEANGVDREGIEWQTIEPIAPSPPGSDIWILLVAADHLGSLEEKEFLETLGPELAREVWIFVVNWQNVPEAERKELSAYAL
ncbi:MAG: hypothetical protein D6812_14625, partial [Deltaproteobacteria bacterium]